VTEDQPSNPGTGRPVGPWPPTYPAPPPPPPRIWPAVAVGAIVLAVVATIVAVVALTVATTRSAASSPAATTTVPTYSPAEVSGAHHKLCDTYKLAARAVQIETNGSSPDRAGIAEVNGAMMLQDAMNATPAISPSDRTAAVALAGAYNNIAAVASFNDNSIWQPALNDANAKDTAMQKVCGGG
jgi:hypothetical protein